VIKKSDYPILEYDPAPKAIVEPTEVIPNINPPERCIVCFFREILEKYEANGYLTPIHKLGSEIGVNLLYEFKFAGERIATYFPGVGAPLAGGFLDEVIALGCRKFIAIGSAGVLDGSIGLGDLVVPVSAVRDEGTSYHYLPPSREVEADPAVIEIIKRVLDRRQIPYILGKTWTTDGFYRETPDKIQMRRAEGCLTVEMETAAFYAVAKFRGVPFGQILYGSDDVSGKEWSNRGSNRKNEIRRRLFDVATEVVVKCELGKYG